MRVLMQSLSGYVKVFANPALLVFSTTLCWRWHFLLALVLTYAPSSSLCSTHARALHYRPCQLADVHGLPHTPPLLQA
jgi:hypothetical protein